MLKSTVHYRREETYPSREGRNQSDPCKSHMEGVVAIWIHVRVEVPIEMNTEEERQQTRNRYQISELTKTRKIVQGSIRSKKQGVHGKDQLQ